MGSPADKTIIRSDQALRETNTSGGAGGNTTTAAAFGLNSSMTGPDATPADSPLAQRAVIDHNYPSVNGHFLDATHESVLQLKETVAGTDAIWQLASPNQAAESWQVGQGSEAQVGTTYAIAQTNTAVTNSSAAQSAGVEDAATAAAVTGGAPSASQLWAAVDSGAGDGSILLVSRADGLCLTLAAPSIVATEPCSGDISRRWTTLFTGAASLISPASAPNRWLGSSGGEGAAGNLLTDGQGQLWFLKAYQEPGGSIPTWSTVRNDGNFSYNLTAPSAMAAGDLDGVATQDDQADGAAYHDEAVVAYTDSNGDSALRVVDYNANASHLLVTSPASSINFGQTGTTVDGVWNPGDLIVDVGDFNGDGRNEIATAYQDSKGDFQWTFWRYVANADGSRSLNMLSSCLGCGGTPFASTSNITLQQGYASSAVGDFDGDGHDDIALAYADNATAGREVDLGVWTLNPDLSTRSVNVTQPSMADGYLPPSAIADAGRTPSGIELVAGNLHEDPANGFGPQRAELAVAWVGYHVGEHYYDPSSAKDYHPYLLKPSFQIYGVATADCNAAGTTCTSSATALGVSPDPSPLFPSHPAQTAYREFGKGYDAAPLSFVVGAFGGGGVKDPPVSGLLASTYLESDGVPDGDVHVNSYLTQSAIVVPWVEADDTLTQWKITDTQIVLGQNWPSWPLTLVHYTAYDRQGGSMVLGAPMVLDLEQNVKENVMAAEPPAEVDWLGGGWSNVSASSAFYLQTKTSSSQAFTSDTSNQNSYQNGVHEGVDVKATFAESLGVVNEKSYVDLSQQFNKQWSGLTQNSTNSSTSWSTDAQAQTTQDDAVSYSLDDTKLYRYPILGSPGVISGATCASGCRAFYDVYMPVDSVHFDNVPGKATDLFQPSWENMNALSYPPIDKDSNTPVPTPDLGGYTYLDQNKHEQTVNAALYNQANTVGGNTGTVTLDFSKSAGSATTTTHSRTWTVGADVKVSGKVSVGVPVLGAATIKTTASSGFDVSKSMQDTTTGTSDTSSSQQFVINFPTIDPGHSYDIGSAYYYGADGAAKVVHGVDLTSNQEGRSWWIQNYGQTADPALNLPGRIELGYDSDTLLYDKPLWLTSPQRQLIRGFQVLQAGDDSSGMPTSGDPYTVNPTAGQQATFEVPVQNYSLKGMTAGTTATWYYVPVDSNDIYVTGSATKFGTSVVPAIPSQGSELIQSPIWTGPTPTTNTMQQYRIFVRLDEAGTAADMHPLAGDSCPISSLEPNSNPSQDPALYDVMRTTATNNVADPVGCGQDNQGYGLVTVSPAATTGVSGERHATNTDSAHAQLAGGGLVDGNPDHLRLTDASDVPTIPLNQRVTGLVHASASLQTDDHPTIAVYDGPVSDGKIIAVTRMNGIDDKTGGTATVSWTPTTPGLHELHEVMLGTSASGEDDEQIMRVNVAPALSPFKVAAKVSPGSVKPGKSFTVSGTTSPVLARASQRAVELQQWLPATKTSAARWTSLQRLETDSQGQFSFHPRAATKTGTYRYRVWKVQTAGRAAVGSNAVTLRVSQHPGPAITLKANKTSTTRGSTLRFSGTVSPWPDGLGSPFIELQARRGGGGWADVKHAKIPSNGHYLITTSARLLGHVHYRVTQLGTSSTSRTVVVKVRK